MGSGHGTLRVASEGLLVLYRIMRATDKKICRSTVGLRHKNEERPCAVLPFLASGFLLKCSWLSFHLNDRLLRGNNVGKTGRATLRPLLTSFPLTLLPFFPIGASQAVLRGPQDPGFDTESILDAEEFVCSVLMNLEDFCMFGHRESAQATVLYTQDVSGEWEDQRHRKMEFGLEVHPSIGQAFRAKATHHFLWFTPYPQVGEVVNVKYHPKSLKVSLDLKGDLRYGEKGARIQKQAKRQAAQARHDALLAAPPGTPHETKE